MPDSPTTREVVVVFGGSSGIGRATAIRFARRRAHLVLASRGIGALEQAVDDCLAAGASSARCMQADINDADAVRRAVDAALEAHGHLDVVVHSAAVMAYGSVEELPPPVFEQVANTAIHGTANVARAVLEVFRRQRRGHLIVVSSLLASVTAPTMGAYVTGKWGQLGLLRTLQVETRDVPDIHISAVAPGGVSTPIYYQAATYIGTTGTPPPPVYSADRVAGEVLARVDHPRRLRQAGFANPLVIAGFRLLPGLYDLLVGPLLRALGMAHDHTPPTDGNVFEPRVEREAAAGPWRGL